MAGKTGNATVAKSAEDKNKETALAVVEGTVESAAIVDPFEDAMKALSGRLEQVNKAKTEDFALHEDEEFWKPTKPGDFIKGVYLGHFKKARYLVHGVARLDKEGNKIVTRVNGTHVLTSALKQCKPGTGVLIVFKEESKTEAGNKINLYEVSFLKA